MLNEKGNNGGQKKRVESKGKLRRKERCYSPAKTRPERRGDIREPLQVGGRKYKTRLAKGILR